MVKKETYLTYSRIFLRLQRGKHGKNIDKNNRSRRSVQIGFEYFIVLVK